MTRRVTHFGNDVNITEKLQLHFVINVSSFCQKNGTSLIQFGRKYFGSSEIRTQHELVLPSLAHLPLSQTELWIFICAINRQTPDKHQNVRIFPGNNPILCKVHTKFFRKDGQHVTIIGKENKMGMDSRTNHRFQQF